MLTLASLTSASLRAATLTSRIVRSVPVTSDSLIVGRAVCRSKVWLLNEHLDLTEVAPATLAATTHAVKGFHTDERPWGLACDTHQSIWTLPTGRLLARITPNGVVVDRRPLGMPTTALFGIGDRLLLAPAPPIVDFPLLATSAPDRPDQRQPWPGLRGRSASSRIDLFARNLVNCGIGFNGELPCWLSDATEIVVSDGSRARRLALSFVSAGDVDPDAPIRDAALVGTDRVWVLITSRRLVNGRRAGRRLLLAANGRAIAGLDLPENARLIVAADYSACLLLTVKGQLIEVHAS